VRSTDADIAALIAGLPGLPGLPGLTVTQFTITSTNGAGTSHARTEVAEGALVTLKAAVLTKRATGPARPAAQSTNAPSWGCANIAPARPAAKPGIAEAVAANTCRFTKAGTNAKVAVTLRATAHGALAACARPTTNANAAACCTATHSTLASSTGATTDTDATTNAGAGIASTFLACARPAADAAVTAEPGAGAANADAAEFAGSKARSAAEITERTPADITSGIAGLAIAGPATKAGSAQTIAADACRSGHALGAVGAKPRSQAGGIAGHAEGRIMCRRHCLGRGRSAGQALYAANGAKITRVRSANA